MGLVVNNEGERGSRGRTVGEKGRRCGSATYQLAYRIQIDVLGYRFNWSYPARSRQGERAGIETFTDRDQLQVPCASALAMNVMWS